jgi:hypothetical protein
LKCYYNTVDGCLEIRQDFTIDTDNVRQEYVVWDLDEDWLLINKLKGGPIFKNLENMFKEMRNLRGDNNLFLYGDDKVHADFIKKGSR